VFNYFKLSLNYNCRFENGTTSAIEYLDEMIRPIENRTSPKGSQLFKLVL